MCGGVETLLCGLNHQGLGGEGGELGASQREASAPGKKNRE